MTITLHEGDNRVTLRRLIDQGVRVHSVVCDPPYGLTSITKRFGKDGSAKAKFGTDGAFARASAGFMGSKWDGTGIERDPEFWALVNEILLPGGYCVAFSGSRTGHWQACAMEMAGFIMHPMLGWVYGSGFPKAHAAGRGMDRAEDKVQWEGWAYGGQALKPALEPIFVGQKPFSEKNGALNILKHGVGAINIDGCRVKGGEARPLVQSDRRSGNNTYSDGLQGSKAMGETTLGRHPANLLHDGSDEVVALFPQSTIGAMKASTQRAAQDEPGSVCYGTYGGQVASADIQPSSGSAARFFNAFPLDADPIRYQAKATKQDRAGSKHPTVKPVTLMEWLVTLVTPPGGIVLDPFAGSGTTGQAAHNLGFDCILMEAEAQFAADIRTRFNLDTNEFDDLLGSTDFDDILGTAA